MVVHRKFTAAIAAVIVGVAGLAARADSVTVTATFNGSQPNTVDTALTSNYNDGNRGLATTTVGTVAGVYDFTLESISGTGSPSPLTLSQVESGLGVSSPGQVFKAVCIDFTHNVWYGQPGLTFKVELLTDVNTTIDGVGISSNQAAAIAYLWQNTARGNANQDATFQMAVWDLIYNGGGSYSQLTGSGSPNPNTNAPTVSYPSGTAHTFGLDTAAASAAANAWTNKGSVSGTSVYALVNTNANGDPAYQSFNFAIVDPAGSNNVLSPVPLPASVGVGFSMLGGFGALFGIRKRLSRRPRIA